MKELIRERLREIETEHNIEILWGVESGSRAWGMESSNSDYDVRFVYKRKPQDYLKLNYPHDVITQCYNEKGDPCQPKGCFIDMIGFDVFKFCRMLTKSNPTCIEWLNSGIYYLGCPPPTLMYWSIDNFSPKALYCHYRSLCEQNYYKYIKSRDEVSYKKYLYSMRGLVSAKYVQKWSEIPTVIFPVLLSQIQANRGKSIVDPKIVQELLNIIELKKLGKEKDIVQNYRNMDGYIESFLKEDNELPQARKPSRLDIIDSYIHSVVFGN